MQDAVVDVVSGVTDCCEGGRVSHIISNRRVHQEAIGSKSSYRASREAGDGTTTGCWCDYLSQMVSRIGSPGLNGIASVTRRADEFLFLEGEI